MTIGIGHAIRSSESFSAGITESQALGLFEKDLKSIVQPALDRIENSSLNQNQANALGSFIFNSGPGSFRSRVLPSLNAGNLFGATEGMAGFTVGRNQATGETFNLPGLPARRQAEIRLFNSP